MKCGEMRHDMKDPLQAPSRKTRPESHISRTPSVPSLQVHASDSLEFIFFLSKEIARSVSPDYGTRKILPCSPGAGVVVHVAPVRNTVISHSTTVLSAVLRSAKPLRIPAELFLRGLPRRVPMKQLGSSSGV